MKVLVTGCAGFIGFHLSCRLLKLGVPVLGFDSLSDYYDPALKNARLSYIRSVSEQTGVEFCFVKGSLEDADGTRSLFHQHRPDHVVNLAAQAGVRYSIENPSVYISSNVVGFANLIELCREYNIAHLLYASSSSVYGGNKQMPFSETHNVDHPVSLYAATKRCDELIAHSYSHLFGLPATGLRFFTVYGPWGRPDMALFLFTKSILKGEPIKIYNNGDMSRDFTYIDDIVESLIRLLDKPSVPDCEFNPLSPNPSTSWAPHRVFNIGNSTPTPLMEYIQAIESALNITAKKEYYPLQPGDVVSTSSDSKALQNWIGFTPNTPVKTGVNRFVKWYREFYDV